MTLANSTKNKMISKLLLFSPVHFPATFVIREKKKKVMVSVVRSFSLSNSDNNQQTYKTLQQRVTCEREIKRSKFIGIAAPICNEESVHSFLSEVRDPRATHNCWAYKLGDQYRSNDDGEPSGTAGKPIYSAIASSGIDRVMVVVIRHFGGIKLGTGGLVRAYGGVASECLRDALTCVVKPKVSISLEVPFDLLGSVYHQLQSSQVEDMKQDFDSGEGSIPMLTFRVDYDRVESLEDVIKANCSRDIVFLRHQQGSSVRHVLKAQVLSARVK